MNEGCHRQPLFIAGNIIKEPSFRTALINSNLIRRLLFSRSFLGSLLCSINYCLSRLGICYRIEIIFSRIDGLNFLDADRDLSVFRLNACNLCSYFTFVVPSFSLRYAFALGSLPSMEYLRTYNGPETDLL